MAVSELQRILTEVRKGPNPSLELHRPPQTRDCTSVGAVDDEDEAYTRIAMSEGDRQSFSRNLVWDRRLLAISGIGAPLRDLGSTICGSTLKVVTVHHRVPWQRVREICPVGYYFDDEFTMRDRAYERFEALPMKQQREFAEQVHAYLHKEDRPATHATIHAAVAQVIEEHGAVMEAGARGGSHHVLTAAHLLRWRCGALVHAARRDLRRPGATRVGGASASDPRGYAVNHLVDKHATV